MTSIEDYMKNTMDKIFLYFNLDTDPIFGKTFKKFIKWLGYKFSPFVLTIASFILLAWIFNRIYTSYGMDKLMILFFVIVVFSLRKLVNDMKKLTE